MYTTVHSGCLVVVEQMNMNEQRIKEANKRATTLLKWADCASHCSSPVSVRSGPVQSIAVQFREVPSEEAAIGPQATTSADWSIGDHWSAITCTRCSAFTDTQHSHRTDLLTRLALIRSHDMSLHFSLSLFHSSLSLFLFHSSLTFHLDSSLSNCRTNAMHLRCLLPASVIIASQFTKSRVPRVSTRESENVFYSYCCILSLSHHMTLQCTLRSFIINYCCIVLIMGETQYSTSILYPL